MNAVDDVYARTLSETFHAAHVARRASGTEHAHGVEIHSLTAATFWLVHKPRVVGCLVSVVTAANRSSCLTPRVYSQRIANSTVTVASGDSEDFSITRTVSRPPRSSEGRACDSCSCCYGIISSGDNSVHSHWPIPLSPRDSGASPPIQRVAVSRPYTTSLSPPPSPPPRMWWISSTRSGGLLCGHVQFLRQSRGGGPPDVRVRQWRQSPHPVSHPPRPFASTDTGYRG